MNALLLDTNVLIRFVQGELGNPAATHIIENPKVLVSHVSLWEIVIKSSLGKLSDVLTGLDEHLEHYGFTWLPIQSEHIRHVTYLPHHHRDPFDRMLIAQAQRERLTIMTSDRVFGEYGVATVAA